MPKLSMVIPTYTITKELEELAIRAIATYREQVDELIVTEDGGMFSSTIFENVDTYIHTKDNGGFTVNVNRGLRFATGDHIAIVGSDTELMSGNLYDLCIPGRVTSPYIVNQHIDLMAGTFFVIPKTIRDERGLLLEEMKIYSSDSEYEQRIKDIFTPVDSVKIFHHQAQTVTAAGVEGGEQQERDRAAYLKLQQEGKAK